MKHIIQFIVHDSHGSLQVPPCTVFCFLCHCPLCHSYPSLPLVLSLLSWYILGDTYLLEKNQSIPKYTCYTSQPSLVSSSFDTMCRRSIHVAECISRYCLTVGLAFHSMHLPHFTHLFLLLWASNSSQELSALCLYNFSTNFLIDPQQYLIKFYTIFTIKIIFEKQEQRGASL